DVDERLRVIEEIAIRESAEAHPVPDRGVRREVAVERLAKGRPAEEERRGGDQKDREEDLSRAEPVHALSAFRRAVTVRGMPAASRRTASRTKREASTSAVTALAC